MSDFAEKAGRLKRTWVTGATVVILLVLSAGVIGGAVGLALTILSELLGWRDGLVGLWLAVTAVAWLPLAIGYVCRQWSFRSLMALGGDELDKYRLRRSDADPTQGMTPAP